MLTEVDDLTGALQFQLSLLLHLLLQPLHHLLLQKIADRSTFWDQRNQIVTGWLI